MDPWLFMALGAGALALAWWLPGWRLRRVLSAPFPDKWRSLLESNIEVYASLPEELRAQLRRLIKQFLHQKHFSGAGGLEMTDEIRVTIAAEACMMILNRNSGVYPGLKYIIVYPSGFLVERDERNENGLVAQRSRAVLGESWNRGKVILSWDSVLRGACNFNDGHNVVLHEFAHQLDSADGATDGAPMLANASSYRTWAAVLSPEYDRLRKDRGRNHRSALDHYGATNPAEFFAVATETFFEKPEQMARRHSELFETLLSYYRVDPRDWSSPTQKPAQSDDLR